MAIVKDEKEQWMASDVWPWWIESDTGAHHWSAKIVGLDRQGGQCDGLFWRRARGEWLQSGDKLAEQKLREYDMPWILAYGKQAMEDALRDTEQAYQASLKSGNTLHTLTQAAERDKESLAADRAATKRSAAERSGKKRGRREE